MPDRNSMRSIAIGDAVGLTGPTCWNYGAQVVTSAATARVRKLTAVDERDPLDRRARCCTHAATLMARGAVDNGVEYPIRERSTFDTGSFAHAHPRLATVKRRLAS